MPAERAGSSPGGQGKAIPVEETAVQLSLPIATAENPHKNDGLHWPRRDGLKWPQLASVVVGVDVA
jgi:hypothetical protein